MVRSREMLLLLILLGSLGFLRGFCPPSEYILPLCTCKDMEIGSGITCSNVFNAEDLIKPIRSLYRTNYISSALEINNSSLRYLPHDLFNGLKFEEIRFISSEIQSLSDSDLAFEGLEDSLTELRATDAHFIASWDWQQLRHMRHLELIDINQVVLGEVSEPLPSGLTRLNALGITRADLEYLVDGAFAELSALRILILRQNNIVEVKRNMLPMPAKELAILDLSENKLEFIPKDFFTGMPQLEILSLQNNKIMSLPQDTFASILQKLVTFQVYGNPISCDCRLTWILNSRMPYTFDGKCAYPLSMAGNAIEHLEYRDLIC